MAASILYARSSQHCDNLVQNNNITATGVEKAFRQNIIIMQQLSNASSQVRPTGSRATNNPRQSKL